MRKYALGLTVMLLALLLVGCGTFDPVNKAINKLRPAVPEDPAQDAEGPFTVELSVPKRAGIDETFTLIASLHNLSKTEYELMSRPRVFHYLIVDSLGNRVNTITQVDSAVVRSMGGETDINEFFETRIDRIGTYEIYAVAEFSIKENGKYKSLTYETEHHYIEIGPYS
ncbi:hypothetical protein U9M73_16710 [Paenibacillus phoenicis]|uniref:Uncharacterized protein n=1 Tax=Paenibacillus phoenicis TaxID=554117 RepID=A0ABU5PPN3_9BACL|nr:MULTISPECIES: hypothetical protein [Paenibacillus]EES74524.1 hypothetical protein POTG_00804 [Paenibacillus sp. oral taxon 786 str. D14]MCT2194329.1 hypothetical protein [Paenibacillus sp. p3-SID1389]MEA3571594.1 hypothetical protein [Paenibacillus phoenicis]